jgi:probable rRNA maturation factor
MFRAARPIPVTLRYRGTRVDRPALRRLVERILEAEAAPPGMGLGVILAGGRLLQRLNRDWRGLDRTTDVLSFPLLEGPPLPPGVEEGEGRLLGEVVISLPRCREQAAEQRVDPGVELVRLVVHGALHVLGHDHERAADRRRMLPKERAYRAWAARQGLGPGSLRSAERR